MTIFHHPFNDIEKLSIVTPFKPDKFLSISQPRITLYIGGQRRRETSYRAMSDQMPDAERQNYEKNRVSKVVKLTPSRNMSKQKQSKMLEREPKKNV